MSSIFNLTDIKETKLLQEIQNSEDSLQSLVVNLPSLYYDAIQRMKLSIKYFPEFTLHDEIHILRMMEIAGIIIEISDAKLNNLEIIILMISIIYHDIGMSPSEDQYKSITNSSEYALFRDEWISNHSNYSKFHEIIQAGRLSEKGMNEYLKQIAEIDQAIFTEFLRSKHAFKSGEFVRDNFSEDKRLEVFGINLSDYIAKLCISHSNAMETIIPSNGYYYDDRIGKYSINMPYLSIILRLSDILDFDRERTPDVLYQSIHFTSNISRMEWEKHRSVKGWIISEHEIRFDMHFEHPVYENVARKFMDIIDEELLNCHIVCRNFPSEFYNYKLTLPQRVNRQRIGPKNNAYLYFDLEFSLSRNEIVNLLMTNNLYGSPSLCVRELLQNSADALRLRAAQFKEADIEWVEGKIIFEHYLDEENVQVLKCQDNGIGMDEDIIRNYFTKVGRSYYRSPEFSQRRLKLQQSNADFDPCSQFGIGFMSTFMFGDKITIYTRKDYGSGKEYGKPLIVEINGTSGIITIREGESTQQIGTTVYIYGRETPNFWDDFSDRIKLSSVLRGYALNIEFPIHVRNRIKEIEENFIIEPGIKIFPSAIQQIKNHITIVKKFNDYNPLLFGEISETFIVDENENICLANNECEWKASIKRSPLKQFSIEKKDGSLLETQRLGFVSVCLDGVLVAGNPGRPGNPRKVRMNLGWRNSNIYANANCCIDIRGFLKPEITPARIPAENSFRDLTPKWQRIQDIVSNAEADIWGEVAKYLIAALATPETFWKLATIYSCPIFFLSFSTIIENINFPLINQNGEITWKQLKEISLINISDNEELIDAKTESIIKIPDDLSEWERSGAEHPSMQWKIENLIISVGSFFLEKDKISILIDFPQSDEQKPYDFINKGSGPGPYIFFISYKNELNKYLSVGSFVNSINKDHALSKLYLNNKYLSKQDGLQSFCYNILRASSMLAEDKSSFTNIRWLKHIGCLYYSIQWDHQNSIYKPPYLLRDKDGKEILLDEQQFEKWKNMDLQKDQYLEEGDFGFSF